jgi:hypothetical protein
MDLYEAIWRGGSPQIALDPQTPRDILFGSYLQPHIQRDVRRSLEAGALRYLWINLFRSGMALGALQ